VLSERVDYCGRRTVGRAGKKTNPKDKTERPGVSKIRIGAKDLSASENRYLLNGARASAEFFSGGVAKEGRGKWGVGWTEPKSSQEQKRKPFPEKPNSNLAWGRERQFTAPKGNGWGKRGRRRAGEMAREDRKFTSSKTTRGVIHSNRRHR